LASEKRKGFRGCRVAFSLDTFYWPRKRKYLAFRCENRIQMSFA